MEQSPVGATNGTTKRLFDLNSGAGAVGFRKPIRVMLSDFKGERNKKARVFVTC